METEVVAAAQWAPAVADRWLERLAARPALRMCLPTGDTPRALYREIAARTARGGASFAAAEVFLLDEFGLPPGHPARCDAMLRRGLLDRVDLPASGFQRLDPCSRDLDTECRRYRALVGAGGLDLALLGLGRNGHVGLNEPGTPADAPARRVDLDAATIAAARRYGGADPPTWGLTLGLAEILAAREVWLLVTGPAKADILRRVMTGPVGPEVPASFLRAHPNARVIADDRALAAH